MRIETLKKREGFSLIELMVVVAIIGILAAIAVPNFMNYQYRARSSEVNTNLGAIKSAEIAYFAENSTFLAAAQTPATVPGTSPVAWPTSGAGTANFALLGWQPEGQVYCTYQVGQNGTLALTADFLATGTCNVDGDSNNATYTISRGSGVTKTSAAGVY